MKTLRYISIFMLLMLNMSFKAYTPVPKTGMGMLIINLSGIDTPSGRIRVGLYDRNNFLTPNYTTARSVAVTGKGNATVTFNELLYGEYAIAVYHDINDNRLLDKSKLGIPEEPYAFSNNFKVYMRPPSYDEVKINFQQPLTLNLKMLRWW
jgi:uncharacterized protein (DUF2141 family)